MKKLGLVLVLLIVNLSIRAQKLYELSTIQTIEITFTESNWDELLDAQKAGDGNYVKAQSVSINGQEFLNVGVKYKGNSTYNANQVKNPLHIELDTYQDQDYNGYTDIKLSNVANDPSFLREVLSYDISRKYMHAPDANYANVYINGTLMGLYTNSESVTKDFIKEKFGSKDNTFVKCNPPAGAGPGTNAYPNLVYISDNSSDYETAYELKSDLGWNELILLCKSIAQDIDNIENVLDVNRALWMLAFNNVFVNLDSYSGEFAQNYYLYRDDEGKFNPVMWDFNESFGRFSQTGSGILNSTAEKQKMSHLLHSTEDNYPLIKQLLSIPMYKRMYIAHMKTILQENFENGAYYEKAQEMQAIIDASVQADNNKFFTYSDFTTNLDSDVTVASGRPGPSSATPGIKNLMEGRSSYLLGLADFTATTPTISEVSLSTETPQINTTITMTVDLENANAAYVGYRNDPDVHFKRVQMFDDGNHNDGAANDGVFGAEIAVKNTVVEYYIYAENDNAGLFSPRRAEHEFHSFTATSIIAPKTNLVINEFMASNESTVSDQDGEYDDWIELYNNSSSSMNISGYYLSDEADDLTKWMFPAGTKIEANGYVTVWADKDDLQSGLHADFKLSASSETIYLSNAVGQLIDEVSYMNAVPDKSFGRIANGVGNFRMLNAATFGRANEANSNTSIASSMVMNSSIRVFPNPANDFIKVKIDSQDKYFVNIYGMAGNLFYSGSIEEEKLIDVSTWSAGIYIVKLGERNYKLTVK